MDIEFSGVIRLTFHNIILFCIIKSIRQGGWYEKEKRKKMIILFFTFSGISLFFFISFIRYVILCNSNSVKNLSKKVYFPAYDIGTFIKKLRYTDFQNNKVFHTPKDSRNTINNNTLPVSPVIADSALTGVKIFHQYMYIDDYMYEGISRLSGENIDTFSDLSAKLETYKHDSQGLTEGSLNKIKGHVAESHVSKHFQEAGIEVEWPAISNQEGWDLLINGNAIQVKLVNDADSLLEHFKNNSDIPVVIPSDADNIPETAFNFNFNSSENIESLFDYLKDNSEKAVIVDNQLSNVDLTESTEQGTDLLTGVTDFNFPFITVAFASFREIKLLKNKSTDIISSLKNAGLDVAGVGGGGTIGGAIGTVILPVIGTIVGSFIGACLGRKITNSKKDKPLKRAFKDYEESIKKLEEEYKKLEEDYRCKFDQDKKAEQSNLDRKAKEIKDAINEKIKNLRKGIVKREKPSSNLEHNLLKNISDTIISIKKELKLSWKEYFWPSKKTIAFRQQMQKMQKMKKHFKEHFKNNKFKDRGILLQKFSEKGLCRQYILSEIRKTEKERKKYENHLVNDIIQQQNILLKQRSECMKRLSIKIKEYALQIRQKLPDIKKIQKYQDCVAKEARKLGKTD